MKRFHESRAFYRPLSGPIGSSKTTGASVAEAMLGGFAQRPDAEGVRTFKFGILRDTYRNLYATTMRTWGEWFPRDVGSFKGSDDRPAEHNLRIDTELGPLQLDVEFRALGASLNVEATCRGWELNGAYCDEADLMPENAVTYLSGRVQRAGDVNLRRSRGVWFTFNKPDVDHHLYRWCEEGGFDGEAPEEWGGPLFEYFDQPGGLLPGLPYRTNPAAENLANLDAGYYVISAAGQPEDYVRRMIRNEWGATVSGERIYQTFRPELHVLPQEIDPPPGSILELGLDGGGTPAAVIGGRDARGRRIIYAEVIILDAADPKGQTLKRGVGAIRFAEAIRDTINLPRFRGCRVVLGYGDPAAFYGADQEAGEYSFMETVQNKLNIPVIPADSNEVGIRHDAVAMLLGELADDGLPMLMINPSCRWLRKGFVADYRWEIVRPGHEGARDRAQKTKTSHVHDACQYWCLGSVGRAHVTVGRRFDRANGKLPTVAVPSPLAVLNPGRVRGEVKGTHYKVDVKLW